MLDLEALGFNLILNKAGWNKGFKEADKDIETHQSKWANMASKIGGGIKVGIVGAVTGITTAVGAMAVAGAKSAIELQDHMGKFQAATGMSAEEAEKVKKTVQELYKVNEDSYEDIAKAAQALHNNMQMGADDIKKYAQNFMDYAKTTGQATDDAIGGLDDVADAWSLANEDIIPLMDKLKYSQEQYGLSVQDSQSALQKLAPALQGLEMNLDDALGYLNLFASTGVESTTATTAFTYALKQVESPEALNEAIAKMQGMTDDTERAKLSVELFGAKAGVAMANALKPGTDSIDALKASMEGADGAVTKASANYDKSLKVQLNLMKKQFEGLFVELADRLMPIINRLLEWVNNNMPQIQKILSTVFNTVGNVISGFVSIIQGVIDVFVQWFNENKKTTDEYKKMFDQFKEWFMNLFNTLKEIVLTTLQIFIELWKKYGDDILKVVKPIFEAIKKTIDTALKLAKNIIDLFLKLVKGDWQGAWETIKQIFVNAWEGIKNILPNLLEGVFNILKGAFNIFKDLGKGMFLMIWEGMKGIWTSISNWVSDKVKWLTDKLMFWKKSSNEMDSSKVNTKVDGSHANGLPYVPYNGYIAELHQGERVLTKQENISYSTGSTGISNNFNIQSLSVRNDNDIKLIAKELYNLQQNNLRGVEFAL